MNSPGLVGQRLGGLWKSLPAPASPMKPKLPMKRKSDGYHGISLNTNKLSNRGPGLQDIYMNLPLLVTCSPVLGLWLALPLVAIPA
jgi:hypothetical protein